MSENSFFSSKNIVKQAIRYAILSNGNKLRASEIQEKIGLKRQTTYNYLNELVASKKISVKYVQHPKKPSINIAYYSVICGNLCVDIDQFVEYNLIKVNSDQQLDGSPADTPYFSKNLVYEDKYKYGRFKSPEEAKNWIISQINYLIAALILLKTGLKSLNDEELKNYLKMNSDDLGPLFNLSILTDEEYQEFQDEFIELINRLFAKWEWKEGNGEMTERNTLLFALFKGLP